MRKRIVLALVAVIGLATIALVAESEPELTINDKAYYADPNLVNFVRPGLVIKVVSASIAADGTIKTRVQIADRATGGQPLDREGIVTPGPVSLSFIAASIPKGQTQYVSYTTRSQKSPITNVSAVQASGESNGTWNKLADGDYEYTFATKAPSSFDKTVTHTIGVYGSRNLTTDFSLPNNFADATFNFVPDGTKVSVTRDVVRTPACNQCHYQLAFHGGSRRSMELCILCHTPQTVDPDTGNTVDMIVMTHKIHMGEELPSVQAGKPYQIIGFNQSVADYSKVAFPANSIANERRGFNCQICHQSQNSNAAQANAWLTHPNRVACGSCHDNVNFSTGEGHRDLPQVSDNQCATCHTPEGELDFDASIKGAHVAAEFTKMRGGVVVDNLKVTDGVAGKAPTISFTLRDSAGKAIPVLTMNRVGVALTGPTSDYGATNFGSGVTTAGYYSDSTLSTFNCTADGTCTHTMSRVIPADAKGTFALGVEARRLETFLQGTKKQTEGEYGAVNKVIYFSVDGSEVQPRRTIVTTAKCNQCHSFLSLHGTNRNQTEYCVFCHNPKETDQSRRPADKKPNETIDFRTMVHKIHTGEELQQEYTVYGFGNTPNNYNEVGYPVFTPEGGVGDRRVCSMCHVNGSENLPLRSGLLTVNNPRGFIDPTPPQTAACLGCHTSVDAASHALINTSKLGESCATCHGSGADFSVSKVHAR
jgi:OmcA/MtrC family decaheme c-type cytochrome